MASLAVSSPAEQLNESHKPSLDNYEEDDTYIKCSAVHTLERDMPIFDYSHLIKELRQKILHEIEHNNQLCKNSDREKCETDDWFISRFLLRHKLNVDAALAMLKAALRFHYEFNFFESHEFPKEFYQIGGLFVYEPDRKGNVMLYIRVKIHRKIPEIQYILEAFLRDHLRRADETAKGKGISIVIDLTGAGLINADMDILWVLISTLSNYFPKGLSYFLVHNLPWILKPFWLIAKAWIPEEHAQLIKFSNQRTIFEYVDKENLPDFLGGTCKRDYTQPPGCCAKLEEATKLWGVEEPVVLKIISKFEEYLPEGTMERYEQIFRDRAALRDGSGEQQDQADHSAPDETSHQKD